MKLIFFIILLFTFSNAVSANYPVTINIKGQKATFYKKPTRVVVFDFAELDTLDMLGITPIAVAKATLPHYLSHYRDRTIAGTLFKPNFSILKQLQPDLIIIGARSKAAINELSEIAPTLNMSISSERFLSDVKRNLKTYGEIFNEHDLAKNRWEALNNNVLGLQSEGKKQGDALVLFTMKDEFIINEPGDRFGMLYNLAGLSALSVSDKNKAKQVHTKDNKLARMTSELKMNLAKNPNWLLLLDRGEATGGESTIDDALEQFPFIRDSNVWQRNHVFYVNANQWYLLTGGYRSILNFVDALSREFKKAQNLTSQRVTELD